jgi:alpha-ribazole phosphatase/probable phosphoglycerate mutase
MSFCTLYLVRHGQTIGNVNKLIHGHTNAPLTEMGMVQAHDRKVNLKDIHFTHIYSSDLVRAHKTAEILNLEHALKIDVTPELRERNYGLYEGKHQDEAKKQLWDLLTNNSNHPHIKESGVETNEQMVERGISFLKKLSALHLGETILVVTHGGLMRVILQHLNYFKKSQFRPGSIENLAFIKLESDGNSFTVKETSGVFIEK